MEIIINNTYFIPLVMIFAMITAVIVIGGRGGGWIGKIMIIVCYLVIALIFIVKL